MTFTGSRTMHTLRAIAVDEMRLVSKALLVSFQIWCILLCLEHCHVATADEMLSSYSSMRALDKFGTSVQLKHAREAAAQHGSLIIGAMTTGIPESHDHQDSTTNSTTPPITSSFVVISVGNRNVVRCLTLPLPTSYDNKNKGMVAMCCTGIKSDVDWLIRHMQKYVAAVWETYDHHPMESSAMAFWLSRLLGSYQDNDLDEEWQSSIRFSLPNEAPQSSLQQQDATLESSLARPLGVQTMLLSTTSTRNEPNLLVVEPTGRVFRAETTKSFAFVTIGKQSEVLKGRLMRSSLENSVTGDLEQLLVQEILETLGSTRGEVVQLVVERIRPEAGIESTLLTCKNGKVQSRAPLSSSFEP